MPFFDVKAPEAKAKIGTGFGFGLSVTKSQVKARLTIRADKQEQFFGGPLAGKMFSVQAGRGADEGLLRIVLDEQGDIEAKRMMHGTVSLSLRAWDLLPKDKRPAAQCDVKAAPSNFELILKLPPWARPSSSQGNLAKEFALKVKK